MSKLLAINLFGACVVRSVESGRFELTGAKHKALFALLATAPFGRRTRAFLQETLWGAACYDTGRQSLRRALSDIKQAMGAEDFAAVLSSTNAELTLDLARVDFIGHPGQGTFLEGLDIREPGFAAWRNAIRERPAQIDGLFSLASQRPPMPILPVVTVMPFRALGGRAEDGVLGDWFAEEVCRSLSRSRLVSVISHLSAREMAQRSIEMSKVRDILRADYCVSGSMRFVGGEILLDADFVETGSGRILWTRQFARSASEFLGRSGEGIELIVQSVGRSIADEALSHIAGRELADIDDHRLIIAGVELMHRLTLSDFARARTMMEEAIRRAPNTPEAHAWLSKWHVLNIYNGWSTNIGADTQTAMDCTARALDMSPDNSFCLAIDGLVQNTAHRPDKAAKQFDRSLLVNPNESLGWLLKGALLAFQDQGAAAVEHVEAAQRISPIDPFGYYYDALSAAAYFANEDYTAALFHSARSASVNDRHLSTLRTQLAALYYLERHDECAPIAAQLMRRQPGFTVAGYLRGHPAGQSKGGQRVAEALSAMGIP